MYNFKKLFYTLLIFVSISIFLLHYIIAGQAVYGDGVGYYSYLHSIVIDGNIDTTNEYKHIYTPVNNNSLNPKDSPDVQIIKASNDGRAENHFGMGVAILLLPFFIIANTLSIILNFIGIPVPTHGYSDIYQIITGVGAVLYIISGLFILEKLISHYIKDEFSGKLTITAIFFATNLLYYGSFDVINSHFASFFLSTLFFYILFIHKNDIKKTASLGFITGFILSVRPQDALVAVIWIIYALNNYKKNNKYYKKFGKELLVFLLFAFLGSLALVYNWTYTYGNPLNHPYLQATYQYMVNSNLRLLDSFFNTSTGLLSTTPILIIPLIYFIYLIFSKKANIQIILLSIFFTLQYIVITLQGGWQAAAYGGRMYISTLPFFAFLLAEFLRELTLKYGKRLSLILVSVFILINLLNIAQFLLFEKQTEGFSMGTEQRTKERLKYLIDELRF
ncbi:MAG: hypothetical protein US60_C0003G0024 [Microgenomates group bacterium GW2011_GWC1_37_8]|uniref:Glycosyltransferase RgtA/B/C/D-like domain-containing protein n=1 Tax=Candidatus Woesebacteria bacterium GW2011_GWB1_38_8 TaxID=1618570 RepID=A0A0G0L1C2_9BACT|nr:MAG: hypothetical protein US60_C0003G0024 [Microgenomates group bacterium GW2011_GWC1_37_8]KKQ85753.1 MAG: hypothetical protein UT08_C0004G0065 [Candidatus Woesebacteria bacterium GW2011_GWB1_38_8]